MSASTSPRWLVVPAPGYYGDSTHVLSSHRSLRAARRAAQRAAADGRVQYCVRIGIGHAPKGSIWYRDSDSLYPIVWMTLQSWQEARQRARREARALLQDRKEVTVIDMETGWSFTFATT